MIQIDFNSKDLWENDRFLKEFKSNEENIELLSLDIFDTLLFRACASPLEVFITLATEAGKQNLLQQEMSPEDFSDIRVIAERTARDKQWNAHHHCEITLDDIYAEVPNHIGDIQKIKELELEIEKRYLFINPNVSSLIHTARNKGLKIVLTSDMYLSSLQLLDILSFAGFDTSLLDSLLISCEQCCSKMDGNLYQKLHSLYPDIDKGSILHIGDNWETDIINARKFGIKAIYYGVVPENFKSPYSWESLRHGTVIPEIKSLRKLSAASFGSYETAIEYEYHQFGASMMGPLLNALCEWAIDTCLKENIKIINPLMREGYLLGPILETAARSRGIDLTVKPLYISRQAVYLPQMEEFTESELDKLLAIPGLKIKDLFNSLLIHDKLEDFLDLLDPGVSGEAVISETANVDQNLKYYLLSLSLITRVNQEIKQQRELFKRYIHDLTEGSYQLVTLDIGFYGTIQSAIDRILSKEGIQKKSIHLLAVSMNQPALISSAHDVRCFLNGNGSERQIAKVIARTPAFLEELSMGEFGTTLAYKQSEDSGHIIPILAVQDSSKHHQFTFKAAVQKGIFAFQHYLNYFRGKYNLELSHYRPLDWALHYHRVIDMPTPHEVSLLGSLYHQDNFMGMEAVVPICPDIEDQYFKNGGDAFLELCNFGPEVLNVFWPQGIVSKKFPYYRYEYFLRSNTSFGYQSMYFRLMLQLKEDKVSEINVYGSGPLVDTVIGMANSFGINVERVIAGKDKLGTRTWGNFIYSELEETALSEEPHIYVIASLRNVETYISNIRDAYKNQNANIPGIYYPKVTD
jgi:predicted HAD superfamily hydrolase